MPQARRGELWMIDLGMTQKPRPCLILSIAFLDHERAVVTYVPRTTSLRNTRFEIVHNAYNLDHGAFDAQGIGTVPTVKLMRLITTVNEATIQQIETAVKLWLKLP